MKKAKAVLFACLILCLCAALGISIHSGREAKDRLALTRDRMADGIAARLHQFPCSYQDLAAQAESEPNASVRLSAEADAVLELLSLFQDSYSGEKTDADISGGILHAGSVLNGYFSAVRILEASGPSEELEDLYSQFEPYCRLLFDWETDGGSYADADDMLRRLTEISQIDSQFQMSQIKQKLEDLQKETVG